MAKKSFEKKEAQLIKLDTLSQLACYKNLADFREKQADLYKLKFRISFVFVIVEAIVI